MEITYIVKTLIKYSHTAARTNKVSLKKQDQRGLEAEAEIEKLKVKSFSQSKEPDYVNCKNTLASHSTAYWIVF